MSSVSDALYCLVQRETCRPAQLGAEGDGVGRATRRTDCVGVAGLAVAAGDEGGAGLGVRVAADDQVDAAALERLAAEVGVVDEQGVDAVAAVKKTPSGEPA